MAIQNRRGSYENYDPGKMVAGEFAVATDEQKLFIAFAPGESKQIINTLYRASMRYIYLDRMR